MEGKKLTHYPTKRQAQAAIRRLQKGAGKGKRYGIRKECQYVVVLYD